MKQFVCDMCGGHDLVKNDDNLFVCQSCGCKYTEETAKKMFVEISGKVEVSGSVSINNDSRIRNLLIRADQFVDQNDYDNAELYYNKVLDIDATNKEAQEKLKKCKETITEPNLYILREVPKPFGTSKTILYIDEEMRSECKIDKGCAIRLPVGMHTIKFCCAALRSKKITINIESRNDSYDIVFNPVGFSIKTSLKKTK